MPALSPTMSQGNIASWQVKEGDEVTAGDVLCDVETDKATMAWENQDDGYVARILQRAGAKDIPVGTPVLILVEDEEHIGAFKDYQPDSSGASSEQPAAAASSSSQDAGSEKEDQQQHQQQPKDRVKASSKMGPAARILLEGAGLSADDVQPTGPGGIITKGDVLAAIEGGAEPSHKPAEKSAAAAPKVGKETAAEQQAQEDQGRPGKAAPAPQHSEAREGAAQGQQAGKQQQQRAGRPRVPDSQIRALLANQMLEKGQPIPAKWLRDWVGVAAPQQASQ